MTTAPPDQPQSTDPAFVYYDGWCSACTKSADLFTKLDRGRGLLVCIDLRSDDPRLALSGLDESQLAASLHTRTPDGTLYAGPDAIRAALTVLGKKRSASWTGWPIIKPIVDLGYRIFARNRLRWFANHTCKDGTCTIDHKSPSPD